MHRSAVFLDRDGVINRKAAEGDYVTSWSDFVLLPGVSTALDLLARHGVLTIVVTNQRAVARGLLDNETLSDIHRRMRQVVSEHGGRIDDVFVCPHDVDVCDCRKP